MTRMWRNVKIKTSGANLPQESLGLQVRGVPYYVLEVYFDHHWMGHGPLLCLLPPHNLIPRCRKYLGSRSTVKH